MEHSNESLTFSVAVPVGNGDVSGWECLSGAIFRLNVVELVLIMCQRRFIFDIRQKPLVTRASVAIFVPKRHFSAIQGFHLSSNVSMNNNKMAVQGAREQLKNGKAV